MLLSWAGKVLLQAQLSGRKWPISAGGVSPSLLFIRLHPQWSYGRLRRALL